MKTRIEQGKASELFFEGKFYKTREDIDVSFGEALRLSRMCSVFIPSNDLEYNPDLWKKEKYFGFTSDVDSVSGWGNVTYNLLKSAKEEYKIALVGRVTNISDMWLQRMRKEEVKRSGVMVWHEQPSGLWNRSPFKKNIAILPFETTRIPSSWVGKVNCMDAVFVPCEQNVQMMKDSGVKIPIEVIHWGFDTKLFPKLQRNNPVFTFGHMGSLSPRKGTDVLVAAFKAAFPNNENVKLICKTSSTIYNFLDKDKRIETQIGPVSHEDLLKDFFQRIDCFVFPTRGEGAGLPPIEAMATGVPAIVTDWSGPADYMTNDIGWKLDYTMTDAKDFTEKVYKEYCGQWAEPSFEHLVKLLRYCYEHQDEVKKKGENAAEHMRKHWTWEKRAKEFPKALNKYL
jgi:glycosyltransferase involved in cell wall biosynthesis